MTTQQREATPKWTPTFYSPTSEEVHINMAVFSVPGVGKTTLAASASVVDGMAPVAIINAESGMESITEDIPGLIDRSAIKITDINNFRDLYAMVEYFAFSKHGFKTLVLDTADEILNRCLTKWTRYYVPVDANGLPLDRGTDDKMGLKIYNRATDEMKNLIAKFRDLPMHVIFTAHETTAPIVEGTQPCIRMDLTPSLYRFTEGAMTAVGRLQYRELEKEGQKEAETHRVLTWRSASEVLRVKDRTPGQKLGKTMVDPTMQRIWDRRTSTAAKG